MLRRVFVSGLTLFTGAVLMGVPILGNAADYPDRPITLIIPYAPGGESDLTARALASKAPAHIGQTIVANNRPGAGGLTASAFVANAKPDGYTLLLARIGSQAIAPALRPETPYKWDGFTMLGLLDTNPLVVIVPKNSEITDFEALVAQLKDGQKRLTFSAAGPATSHNMAVQVLLEKEDLPGDRATVVPYNGGSEVVAAVLGGHVDFSAAPLAPAASGLASGDLRALAVISSQRLSKFPDLATVAELGYPELNDVIGWSALYGPPGMSAEVVERWAETLQALAADTGWLEMEEKMGAVPDIRSPKATKEFVRDQIELYQRLAKRIGS